ncbi:MAG: hypothetical protein ACKVT1_00320 [Dehalococcoidia bacterium]
MSLDSAGGGQHVWTFRRITPAEMASDPIQRQFFQEDSPENLIREAIQNSLDARSGSEPVRIRIQFSGQKYALAPARAARYLDGLRERLDVGLDSSERIEALAALEGPMPFLTFEDFGTRGLAGKIDDWPSQDPKNDFNWFWRNTGRTGKLSASGGRWGVGKWVFPASSRIGAYFGLTSRSDSPSPILMGQVVLKTHTLNGDHFDPYGFFCLAAGDVELRKPFSDEVMLGGFASDFRLFPRSAQATGLSVVVPYPVHEIDRFQLRLAVLRNYFWPILNNRLTVEITDGDLRQPILNREAVVEFMRAHLTDVDSAEGDVASHIALAEWLRAEGSSYSLDLAAAATGAPDWSNVPLEADEELRTRFHNGEPIAARVRLSVQVVDHDAQSVEFSVALRKELSQPSRPDEYIRDDITVPDVKMMPRNSVRSIVVIPPGVLADLLGDSEAPAHRDWDEREARVRTGARWVQGVSRVRFVRHSARHLAEALLRRPAVPDEDLLNDVFWVDEAVEPTPGEKPVRKPPALPILPRKPRAYSVAALSDGVAVKLHASQDGSRKSALITLAYDRRIGNAFTHFDVNDFHLDQLDITSDGASIDLIPPNRAIVNADSAGEARIEFRGFDRRRDVIADVRDAP